MNVFKGLYEYRELLKTSIKKDIRGRYKNSILGVFWSFLNPLLQLAVYAIVFPLIMKSDIPNYTVFVCCGLIPWTFFSTAISRTSFVMVENGNIIKKVYFPREILPISNVTSNLLNFLISCIIIVASLFISGIGIGASIIYLPLIVLLQYIFSLAISFILSSITVYIRDLEYFVSVLMMLWFYLTPVLYEITMIPAQFRAIFNLNPMVHIITAYRDILYYQKTPDMLVILGLLGGCILLLILGYFIFNKCEKKFAEEL